MRHSHTFRVDGGDRGQGLGGWGGQGTGVRESFENIIQKTTRAYRIVCDNLD